jgi:DNA-binding NtrC family response regulator
MGGLALAERLKELRPDTPVLMMSGYPDEEMAAAQTPPGPWAMIDKPFTASELGRAVRHALSRPGTPLAPNG